MIFIPLLKKKKKKKTPALSNTGISYSTFLCFCDVHRKAVPPPYSQHTYKMVFHELKEKRFIVSLYPIKCNKQTTEGNMYGKSSTF